MRGPAHFSGELGRQVGFIKGKRAGDYQREKAPGSSSYSPVSPATAPSGKQGGEASLRVSKASPRRLV